jgi:hypothetical protein
MKSLVGLKFTRLTVIGKTDKRSKNRKVIWSCLCDCGNYKEVQTDYLTSKDTKSCGCYKAEVISKLKSKHNLKKHPLYNTWLSIRDRCNNKNNKYYNIYGGRGIKVCKEWDNFKVFLDDMGEKPESDKRLSIDRIDSNGDYCKSNCRWADDIVQANNRRNSKRYEVDGKLYSVRDIMDINNLSYSTIMERIEKNQNPLEPNKRNKNKENGQ